MSRPKMDPTAPVDAKEIRRQVNLERRTRFLYGSYTMADLRIVNDTILEMAEERTIGVYTP